MLLSSSGELPGCLFIATGGTIAMQVDPLTSAPIPALSGSDLLKAVPELAAIARLEVNNLSNVPSVEMGPLRWLRLHREIEAALAREDIVGVLVSHGTDTLEETAWFLDLTLTSRKPVVLIGAQRNASEADFDGPRNLRSGIRVCIAPESVGKGVMVVLNDQINAAREVSKTHTSDVESFNSGDAGLLGRVDGERVTFYRSPCRRYALPLGDTGLPRVDIVPMYAGADGALLRAAVQAGARGLVIQALGAGNVNTEMHAAILEAIALGITVVIASRVPRGRVRPVYGFTGGGVTLRDAGALFANDLSAQKARILLMLAMQVPRSSTELHAIFDQ
ncbi:asparaginase [Pseudomonas gingeri]|uniref:Glutaminase-asparaginase n=1 Tax=Pseudomonas gingeri TaxID=117681 RepID=A0A7Y7YAM0_9PSED|nr:asparaginase [Pseudomonas gingeri]NVZ99098.1 asparaginase [Pseudomonas gingeri]NWA13143.1 asparaginase [Pseudomonas gingeri]NWA55404.1 asparaginase [Pseudomonas gingeri]NWA95742.1 asparaginase [Pseudomonas gingeri]NWB00830.1 asparaginase [Pseudomonas gingeri]